MLFVGLREQRGNYLGGFGGAEKQVAIAAQREMENFQRPLLHLTVEINQQVAAADQIHFRERRIAQHVMRREQNRVAQLFLELVVIAVLNEKLPQTLRRHVD